MVSAQRIVNNLSTESFLYKMPTCPKAKRRLERPQGWHTWEVPSTKVYVQTDRTELPAMSEYSMNGNYFVVRGVWGGLGYSKLNLFLYVRILRRPNTCLSKTRVGKNVSTTPLHPTTPDLSQASLLFC